MKLKDLTNVLIAGMPVEVKLNGEMLISVSSLYFGGHCMIPESVMEMEVELVSLATDNGLVVDVK